MSMFKRIVNRISPDDTKKLSYWVVVRCNRCGEIVRARVHLYNDLSVEYGEHNERTIYQCRKTLIGEKLCFQRIEVRLTFDENRHVIDREIKGGTFVE